MNIENLEIGSHVVVRAGDGKHYCGHVKEIDPNVIADLKWRRHYIQNADLNSNYYRLISSEKTCTCRSNGDA